MLKYCKFNVGPMPRFSDIERLEMRLAVHFKLWEMIHESGNIPEVMLKRMIIQEFKYSDNRSIRGQIRLMESEGRIRITGGLVQALRAPEE